MRLLVDQDVYQITVEWLREEGHDVLTAKDFGVQRFGDEDLLIKAVETERLFLTRDKGFGALAFLKGKDSAGVILLRITPPLVHEVHQELRRLFREHKEEDLKALALTGSKPCFLSNAEKERSGLFDIMAHRALVLPKEGSGIWMTRPTPE